jgi:succinate dehydrogenase / fumarate reductase flavoprotein subunit
VAAWEFQGVNGQLDEKLNKENLEFDFVELKQRSYK